MNLLCKSIETLTLSLNSPPPPLSPRSHQLPLYSFKFTTTTTFRQCRRSITPSSASDHPASPASMSEIDMVQTKEGVFAAKPKKVVILWDLDNKPPRGPPYDAAMALKNIANHFGELVDVSAYANRHAFIHLPHWVVEQRRDQRRLDILERKGVATPSEPYLCGVCGRKCKTNLDLKKHFKQLHMREREKKMNRMKSLKGKKRQRFKERFITGNHKYTEAARTLVTPKTGYGLAAELRRAGVFVKTVEDKPQAADWALKRQMQHSMSRGIDWLVLVSDDSDFSEMLRRAKASNLGTVVVGDWDRALGRQADLWVPWNRVENGEITEEDLVLRTRSDEFLDDVDNGVFVSSFDGDMDENIGPLDGILDELVAKRSGFNQSKISAFSEGEDEDEDEEDDYLSDSDDEAEDWYT
ncbi:uncharacterized protein LOC111892816 [Lactuca sativa]|uniref:C2H2-type domain-containing protein n=1 Tax=Lactuca sativa TaxID=4236 RepID=A0A9R1XH85_LACSA|nr:uncharacterized protein LOC111892816 [Lactuca sativa]KAJ0214540.1 hypothetical protein LSAT_V11C400206530 [Lactuca sativa]